MLMMDEDEQQQSWIGPMENINNIADHD